MDNERGRWWITFAAAFAVAGCWALATPLLAGPDEAQHAIRAAAEVRGEMGDVEWIAFGPAARARAPEAYGVADEMVCASVRPDTTPACQPAFEGDDDLVDVTTYEFRPPPAYYWAVGWLTIPWPASAGVYAMRLATAAVCAAFLASALASAGRARHPAVAQLGVLVAATPMALYLAGQVNPNGVEVAAAISLWATSQLLVDDEVTTDTRLVTRAGVALAVLSVQRGLSAPAAILAVVIALAVASRQRRRDLAERTDVRVALIVGVVSAIASLVWTWTVYDEGQVPRTGRGIGDAPGRTIDFLRQAVGVFGSLDFNAPVIAVVLWGAAAVVCLTVALLGCPHRARVATGVVGIVALVVPITVDSFDFPSIGFDWQGRYSLPLYAGVVIVAAMNAASVRYRGALAAVPAMLAVAQVAAFVGAARELGGGSAFEPEWEPTVPVPLAVIFLAFVAGAGILAATVTPQRTWGLRR